MDTADVARLLDEHEDDLFAQLGFSYGRGDSRSVSFRDAGVNPEVEKRKGQALFDQLLPTLKQRLCVEWGACSRIASGKYPSASELVLAVAEILVQTLTGFPVMIVSVLLVKIGLRQLCECA